MKRLLTRVAIALTGTLSCLMTAGTARAQLVISKDTTIDFAYGNGILVGTVSGANRTSPTLTLVNGARITNGVFARNASTVNMDDGWVDYLAGGDESKINISGGTAENLTVLDHSGWRMDGGMVRYQVFQEDSSTGTLLKGTIGGSVYLGLNRHGAGSEFTMEGGTITGGLGVERFNAAFVRGGTISGASTVQGSLTVSGSPTLDSITLRESGKLHLRGGMIKGLLEARGLSSADVLGGNTMILDAYEGATVRMSGGYANYFSTNDKSAANIYGGNIKYASAFNTSTINLYKGTIDSLLLAANDSRSDIHDGWIYKAEARNNAVINLYGGEIYTTITGYDNGQINIYGGRIGLPDGGGTLRSADLNGLYAYDQSLFSFYGHDLSSQLLDPDYKGMFSFYELSGLLSDGTDITGERLFVQNGTGAGFRLFNQPRQASVPEPGSAALLLAGAAVGAGLALRQRRVRPC